MYFDDKYFKTEEIDGFVVDTLAGRTEDGRTESDRK